MKNSIKQFIDWYMNTNSEKNSNYFKNNFKSSFEYFEQKLNEINNEFLLSYSIEPFDIDLNNSGEIENKIELIKANLELKDKDFVAYNKKFGNGIPNALLGKNNYLDFLTNRLIELEDLKIEYSNFFLRREFVNYLIREENYTVGSANSYASYVSSVNNKILKDNLKIDFFGKIDDYFTESGNTSGITDLLDLCISIALKKADKENKNKFKSGLTEYKNFLLSLLIDQELLANYTSNEVFSRIILENKEETSDLVRNTSEVQSFKLTDVIENKDLFSFEIDRDSLFSNFKMRMITQDRLYGDVFFPIRFLKKLFYQKAENKVFFDNFISEQIKNIKIFTSINGDYILFKDIDSLIIDESQKVFIKIGGQNKLVYTELEEQGVFDVLKVSKLREIAIDHIEPMKNLLQDKNELRGLYNLTELLKSKGINKSGKESVKRLSIIGNEIIETDLVLDEDVFLIKNNFDFLIQKIDLQLMCSKQNLAKKNR